MGKRHQWWRKTLAERFEMLLWLRHTDDLCEAANTDGEDCSSENRRYYLVRLRRGEI